MTAAIPVSPGPRPHGFDRALMRLSVALMIWAQNRAGSSLSAIEHARVRAVAEATARREHEWALRAYFVR